jgi:hypothetical protein
MVEILLNIISSYVTSLIKRPRKIKTKPVDHVKEKTKQPCTYIQDATLAETWYVRASITLKRSRKRKTIPIMYIRESTLAGT